MPRDSFRVRAIDWDPSGAGFVTLSNYWMRFWRPYLGPRAAMLCEQLLTYTHEADNTCFPSMDTLADALGVDRRTIYGWPNPGGGERKPGLLHRLRDEGLLEWSHDPRDTPVWTFLVRRRPPLLTPEQVERLRPPLQRQHREWLDRNAPRTHNQNKCSTLGMTADADVVANRPDMVGNRAGMVATTRTLPRNTTQHHEGRKEAVAPDDRDVDVGSPDPRLRQLWEAVVSDPPRRLPAKLARTLPRLTPLSLSAGTLTLAAVNTYEAELWAHDPYALDSITQAWPGPSVTRCRVIGPGGVNAACTRDTSPIRTTVPGAADAQPPPHAT